MTVYAYKYGCLPPLDWREDATDCLYRQNRLWNRLVEIEHENRDKWRSLMAEDPAVADLEAKIADAQARIDAVKEARKAARIEKRRVNAAPAADAALSDLVAERKALAALAKAARQAAKADMKPKLDALADERYQAVTAARQEAAAGGLWWGHYNAVLASYETARVRAMKEGADLKFHSFDGQGRFTNQIQGGATLDDLRAHRGPAWIDPAPAGQYRAGVVLLRITLTTNDQRERNMLTLPMVMHRPLPDGARIKQVVVTRRKVGTRWRFKAVFTLDDPAPPAENGAVRACGVNHGFRQVAGGLRVAMRVDSRGRESDVLLPQTWIDRMNHVSDLQSRLDERLNEVHAAIRAWWRADDAQIEAERAALPDAVRERAIRIAAAPKIGPGKLAAFALGWREAWEAQHGERFDERPRAGLLADAEAWRRWDKRRREEMDNLRDKLLAQRREIYRTWAADTARDHAVVAVTEMDLREIARLESRDEEPTQLGAKPRSNRQLAAPSELVGALKVACQRHGARFLLVKGAAGACHACGAAVSPGADLIASCPHCGSVWDQDVNAARNACRMAAGDGRERDCADPVS